MRIQVSCEWRPVIAAIGIILSSLNVIGADEADAPLPAGVKAVWDYEKAFREKTPMRERVCLNGLWRWQPAVDQKEVPAGNWGFFKVPGCWPGVTDYMQSDSQTLYAHPAWKGTAIGGVTSAWYQRELTVPNDWTGRRIALSIEYLNSFANAYIDGKKAGELFFPGTELEITTHCAPGKHVLSLCVTALPLKGVMMSYSDSASAKEVKGKVERRGLCGDVWLVSTPWPQIADARVDTSVRKGEIAFDLALKGFELYDNYTLRVQISDDAGITKEFTRAFKSGDLIRGRITIAEKWKPEKLWDIHTPQNHYSASLTLLAPDGKTLDTKFPVRFGFREFWIDGRDFYLNGTRIYLSCVPYDNASVSAAAATYEGAKETLLRLKSLGINFLYTHNYGCEPGTHLSFTELLRAADDVGMLVSFSQPHFGQYDWKAPDADEKNGYARHAEYYVRAAQNHPSVVFYSMSHNGTGYNEDMNPDLIDGLTDPRPEGWAKNNSTKALRAEAIVHKLDPSRLVYHHASGDLGIMWNANFYPNMVPIQEMSDWFEHWSTKGIKPAFTCEYAAPMSWDWSMYRGWFRGKREFGSANVQWEFCFAEWNSQFLGDRAFKISEFEKANLRYEAKQFRANALWHRWDYPNEIGSNKFDDRNEIYALYTTDNWRAFRTWGLSGNSPWDSAHLWKLRDGADRSRKELKTDWESIQHPGFSPDFVEPRMQRMDMAFERSDWIALPGAQALIRNNQPLLAYIGGKAEHFTTKDHNFLPGETVEKQLILINNSRETATCECNSAIDFALGSEWARLEPSGLFGIFQKILTVPAGDQLRVPMRFKLPDKLPSKKYEITATVKFSTGETQTDAFTIHVMAPVEPAKAAGKIAIFDPKGETTKLLESLGVKGQSVDAAADLAAFDTLIVGKGALTPDGPGPNVARVRDGLKVIVFEQTAPVLEQRFGFRVEEYGLRNVFKRVPDHPLLAGLDAENLRDWRGSATIMPPMLRYETGQKFSGEPFVKWCGIDVTRLWRCGNRGNVASVLIEKPARGDFLPIIDGAFSLQYSPLMEYHEGKGMVLFCQMDVTGRTEDDPAARRLARNIVEYVCRTELPLRSNAAPNGAGAPFYRKAFYLGDAAARNHLEKAGVTLAAYEALKSPADEILIIGPGAVGANGTAIGDWIKSGGNVIALGLDEAAANEFLPSKISMKKTEHIVAYFDAPGKGSPFTGIGPADTHSREPRELPLVSGGASILGDGVLASAEKGNVVFCQLAPWTFDYSKQYNLKRAFRRSSCLLARLLGNMGVAMNTPLLERFNSPAAKGEQRWLDGFYLDKPEEMDDPYRHFRW
ncbi:MAG TPA: glycoside hydrolase family 2 TIM barrel-domain containing protein [Planctomycetota bacterium]|nr:glycoside hydrolase family 2 TIM barrel-domain containing protein [Planctomycetota bacterium]